MKNALKGLALAISMLSIIPFFKIHNFFKGINGYAVMFYPLVGLILGLILLGLHSLLTPYMNPYHLGVLIFALLIVLTGALHLDGFSDTIDGLFVDKERALNVMKDPNTGGMGMIFSATFLILKASSITLLDAFYMLPIILMLSRLNAVIAIFYYPYISKNGIGTLAKQELTKTQLYVAIFYSFLLTVAFNSYLLAVGSIITLLIVKHFFIKRYGGFTGDIYGFTIEVTELILLNLLILGILG